MVFRKLESSYMTTGVFRNRLPLRATAAFFAVLATLAALVNANESALAAGKSKFNNVLAIGDKAPEWENLPGVDGKPHSLADCRDAKAVVIVFTCNHCPVAKMHEDRLIGLTRKYEKDVQVVAISVSRNAADGLDKMKIRAAEKKYPFPYLYDQSQKTGRSYGATATPQFFLLDGDRKIAYMGAFDDSTLEPDKAQKHYLVDALKAVLDGKDPRVRESLQRGCAIEYE
jgi:peroxiredoxin